MKKPTAYLPLYGNDFFEAIAGYPEAIGLSYLRALWHYWNHTGCEGLPDDDDYLRRVCCCDAADWPRIKAILFDDRYLFRLEDGLWHQPRCRKEWAEAVLNYDNKVRRTEAARAVLAAKRTVTKSVTKAVTR